MFEKEAKEYAIDAPPPFSVVREAFQKGAEHGYSKANEWHYPSNGEYPKSETWVVGVYYGKDNWHKIFYRADGKWWGEGQLCQPPFAWKEIVLPSEPMRSLDKEEQKNYTEAISKVYKPTGVKLFDKESE